MWFPTSACHSGATEPDSALIYSRSPLLHPPPGRSTQWELNPQNTKIIQLLRACGWILLSRGDCHQQMRKCGCTIRSFKHSSVKDNKLRWSAHLMDLTYLQWWLSMEILLLCNFELCLIFLCSSQYNGGAYSTAVCLFRRSVPITLSAVSRRSLKVVPVKSVDSEVCGLSWVTGALWLKRHISL